MSKDTTISKNINKELRGDILKIDPRQIESDPEFNARRSQYPDYAGLKASIAIRGVVNPLHGYRKDNGKTKYFVTDGHNRLQAVMELIQEGVEIKRVPFLLEPRGYNQEDRILGLIIHNSGVPLTMMETGETVLRLNKLGWEPKELAQQLGKTQSHVSNLLKLGRLPKLVRDEIHAGKIAATYVLDLMRTNPDENDLVKAVNKEIKKAENQNKTRATKKRTGGNGDKPPSKTERLNNQIEILKKVSEKQRSDDNIAATLRLVVSFINPENQITEEELKKEIAKIRKS